MNLLRGTTMMDLRDSYTKYRRSRSLKLFPMIALMLCISAPGNAVSERQIVANGIAFHVLEQGSGPLVLLLHGYPESAKSWDKVQVKIAAAGYRVVAPYLRGYPPTEASPTGDYQVKTLGADVLGLISALGEEHAIVIGHDWGAFAALSAVVQSPGVVERLVMLAVPHPLGTAGDPSVFLEAPHFLYYQLPFIELWVRRNDFAHVGGIYQAWSPTYELPAERLEDAKALFRAEGGPAGMLGYYWSFFSAGAEGLGALTPKSKIEIPSLMIAGADDGALDTSRFETARPAFTGPYSYIELDGVGHFPQLEAPDAVADHILSFLKD